MVIRHTTTVDAEIDNGVVKLTRQPTGETISFEIEAEFFQEEWFWPEGFAVRETETGATIISNYERFELSHDEFAWLHRLLMRYRANLLV